MTRNDLADVLVKVLGLSMALYAAVGLPQLIVTYASFPLSGRSEFDTRLIFQMVGVFSSTALRIIIGIYVIRKSSAISNWLLRARGDDAPMREA